MYFRTLCGLRCLDLTYFILSQTLDWKLPDSYEGNRPHVSSFCCRGGPQ